MYTTGNFKSSTQRYLARPGQMLVCLITGLYLAACAGNAPAPDNGGEFTVERAQNRWDALLSGDYDAAYAFYSPGYRSSTPLSAFTFEMQSRRVRWTSAKYKEHSCLENSCTSVFDVGFTIVKPVPGLDKWDGTQLIDEQWVKTDGQWWFLPKK